MGADIRWAGLLFGLYALQAGALEVQVRLQGSTDEPFSRAVVFVASDVQEKVLGTWEQSLDFEQGLATDTLTDVPGDTHYLSAKTAWTLRVRVAVTGSGEQRQAEFTGEQALPGGDLNDDNRVDALDFAILRYHWFTENTAADLTGDGRTTAADYAVLKGNWYRTGDAP